MKSVNIKIWNTKQEGLYEFFVYPNPRKREAFLGVCLTLNIVDEGKNAHKLINNIVDAALGYIKVIQKENLSDELLNRPAPKKYWDKYKKFKHLKNELELGKKIWRDALATQYFHASRTQ